MSTPPEDPEAQRKLEEAKRQSVQAIRTLAFAEAKKCWVVKKSSLSTRAYNSEIANVSLFYMVQMLIPKIFENFKQDWEEADKTQKKKIPCPITLEDCLIDDYRKREL
jgi:hypothetical protein